MGDIAVRIGEMAHRLAQFALKRLARGGDLAPRLVFRQLRHGEVIEGMRTDRRQRMTRQFSYLVPAHDQFRAEGGETETELC